jgi:hypothetical protein
MRLQQEKWTRISRAEPAVAFSFLPVKNKISTMRKGSRNPENANPAGMLPRLPVAAAVDAVVMAGALRASCMMPCVPVAASRPRSPSSPMALDRFIAAIASRPAVPTKGTAFGYLPVDQGLNVKFYGEK